MVFTMFWGFGSAISLASDKEGAALDDGAGLFGPAPEDKASLTKYHAKMIALPGLPILRLVV